MLARVHRHVRHVCHGVQPDPRLDDLHVLAGPARCSDDHIATSSGGAAAEAAAAA